MEMTKEPAPEHYRRTSPKRVKKKTKINKKIKKPPPERYRHRAASPATQINYKNK
jgi:hypothetical protein